MKGFTFTRTVTTERRIENGVVVEVKTTITTNGDPEVEKQVKEMSSWFDDLNKLFDSFPFR